MSEETVSESQFSLKTAVLRVFDLPLSWYYSLSQIKFSPVAKKLFVVTAVSAVSVIFLAHHFKRRRGKKKGKILPWEPEHLVLEYTKRAASDKGSSCSSSRQNLTLSLSSAKDKGSQSCNYANGGLFSKYSGSAQSLASVQSVNSCHSCACGNSNSWDKADEDDIKLVNIPVTTPENLYLMGMELFEEALRRWEQALTFRNRQAEDEACSSIKLGAGDAIAEESVDDIIKDLEQEVLCITVFERDQFSPDDFLGRTEIRVADIKKDQGSKGPVTKCLLLHEVPTGEIVVRLDLQLFDEP